MIDRQRAAANAPPPMELIQAATRDMRDYEVSPSLDKGTRHTHGAELARRLKRLWHPPKPGDGGWMNNR
jgi:hypothetical protein